MKQMTFEELRVKAKTGDVISFKGSGIMSWLLKLYTKEEFSHVGFVIWLRFGKETADRMCVFHSEPFGGVVITPLSAEVGSGVTWQATKLNGDEAVGYALAQWGRRYASAWQFVLIVSPWLRKKWEAWGLTVKSNGKFHCSQLVSEAIAFAHGAIPKDAAEMTPGDVTALPCLEEAFEIL